MKKTLALLLTALSIVSPNLKAADIDLNDIGSEHILPRSPETGDSGPFTLHIDGDWVGKADVRKRPGSDHIKFWEAEADLGFIFYHCPDFNEIASLSVSYTRCRMDLEHNPYFHQKNFSALSLNFSGFTERICGWLWRGQVSVNFDPTHWDLSDYVNYDFLLWGRYNYAEGIGVHVGAIGYTGMKIDRVYPIVGFDYQYDPKWKLNVVFPVNMSIVYRLSECWSTALALRAFDTRYRTGSHQPLRKALFTYRAAGAEIGFNYNLGRALTANIHAGHLFGGTLRITDRHYRHRHKFRFNSAPYAGGEILYNF